MSKPKVVYILRARGVYWQDIYGVFDNLDDAVAHATEIAKESDGYHTLVISPWLSGASLPADRNLKGYGGRYSKTEIKIEDTTV